MADPMDPILDAIARLGKLPKDAAPDVARALEGAIRQQMAAGTDPSGKAWQPTQAGEKPLQDAASALRVVNVGAAVFARLAIPHVARHNNGTARGGVRRQIFPTKGIPPAYVRPIKAALDRDFEKAKTVNG